MQGIRSDFYHAGLTQEERSRKQESWIKNETRTIVCTNAFGMGIDKPDVRVVIHADTPDCLENYYQEAGRAGRDGLKSYAVLLYDAKELEELKKQPEIRFPGIYEIRKVYQALVNYLQIPTGLGEGRYYDFERTNPELTPLIKVLLRTYEGIFDQPVPIFEKNLAFLLRADPAQVNESLKKLQAFGTLLPIDVSVIEQVEGGSARCMMAEIFLAD